MKIDTVDWPSLANDIKYLLVTASEEDLPQDTIKLTFDISYQPVLNILQAFKKLGMPESLVRDLEANYFMERTEDDVIEHLVPEARQLRQSKVNGRMRNAMKGMNK